MGDETLQTIDDRNSNDFRSALSTEWHLLTDGVMGGVSSGRLTLDVKDGKSCLCMRGNVSLDNGGGFIQAVLPLGVDAGYDASAYSGLQLEVYGNDEVYNVHLKTSELWLPWQAFRQSFSARAEWQTIHLPFNQFEAYRTDSKLNVKKLERIGIVAIGREFTADLCIAGIALYKE
ncbi:CIA30 family protein [Kaarinaea lacus]